MGAPVLRATKRPSSPWTGLPAVLGAEAAPFGIRTMVVEPSGFATDWAGSSMTVHHVSHDYDDTVGVMERIIRSSPTGPAGDPVRAAEIIVQVAKRDVVPSHLLLGVNAVDMALDYSQQQLDQAQTWEQVSRSADFVEPYPPRFPPEGLLR